MKKSVRIVLLFLTLTVFCLFAVGSNSSESKSSGEAGADGDIAQSTTESYEVGEGIVKTWTDTIGENYVAVAVPVKNTSSYNLYLSSATIDIEDESGALVQTVESVGVHPQVIEPGETAYYYEVDFYDGDMNSNLSLLPHVNVEKAKVDCIRYELSELQIKENDYSSPSIKGRVQNTTDEESTMVYVVANIFDNDGNFICQEFTILDNSLPAGDKIGFETNTLSREFSIDDFGTYEVYAYPDQFQF